jgi:UDP-N-acetylglucosamine 2-epimerase (non-hydrolysing)
MVAFETLLDKTDAHAVVVVGDVNSTLACSVVAAKAGTLVAHVEAGLRSRDWAMPEEVNRVVTDRVSDYLFAPSADAVDNLRAEGYRDDQIHLVGNVMVDTLFRNVGRARERGLPPDLGVQAGQYGLLTLHRPSNVDDPAMLAKLLGALGTLASDVPIIFPAHPRTRERMASLDIPPGIAVTAPLGYLDFLALQADAAIVLTDSGGIQEETTALGVPCLTLRETTERPITITEGTNHLVGTDPDAIIAAGRAVLAGEFTRRCPALWDGKAAPRIARVILDGGDAGHRLRPTALPER